mmetsp:Transcript_28074/g.43677  ORF Transcript_28074/g.43677 Transcript_28074/m.43677 type:complete len:178 (+) Transcript_28074:58-591(+)
MKISIATCSIAAFNAVAIEAAFGAQSLQNRKVSALYLDPKIAEMLDEKYHMMTHPEAALAKEREFQRRNAQYKPDDLPSSFDGEVGLDMMSETSPRQLRKDKKMAKEDPQAYCAERCVSTGNCEVYEDVFDFSPEEVMSFCTDCVLSEKEDPCELPPENMDAFFESLSKIEDGGLKP